MSLCRINLFDVFILSLLFFLSQKTTMKKRGQIKCGGDVPDHHGIGCCTISICPLLVS